MAGVALSSATRTSPGRRMKASPSRVVNSNVPDSVIRYFCDLVQILNTQSCGVLLRANLIDCLFGGEGIEAGERQGEE